VAGAPSTGAVLFLHVGKNRELNLQELRCVVVGRGMSLDAPDCMHGGWVQGLVPGWLEVAAFACRRTVVHEQSV
jgi:hypothetical protein